MLQCFAVQSRGYCFVLESSLQAEFTLLDSRTTEALQNLSHLPLVRFQAILERGSLDEPGQQLMKKGEVIGITVSINIYGPRSIIKDVNRSLSKAYIYLQHPPHLDEHVDYKNPHYFELPNRYVEGRLVCHLPQASKVSRGSKEVDLAEVFQSTDHCRHLQSVDVTSLIKTPLLRLASWIRSVTTLTLDALVLVTKKKAFTL